MSKLHRLRRLAILSGAFVAAFAMATPVIAATLYARANAAWNVGTTWSTVSSTAVTSCGCTPQAGDTVIIGDTAVRAVTVPASFATATVASITIGNTAQNGPSSLTLSASTSILNATAVSIDSPKNNNTFNGLYVNAGTATLGSLSLAGGNGNRNSELSISTGTATVTGDISFSGSSTSAQINFTGAGTLRVGGALGNGGTLSAGTGTVEYIGPGTQTINQTYSYNNLSKSGAGTATLGGNTTVAGNLTISAGTLDLSTFTANRTAAGGTITIANGATLNIGSPAGTNGFPANYSTQTLGATSTVVYNGANQTVAAVGGAGYGNLTFSGSGTKTAAGSFTVQGNLTITGVSLDSATFTQTVRGNVNNTGTATNGLISLSGGSVVHVLSGTGTYNNLQLNDVLGASLSASPTVSGTLTLTSGVLTTGVNTLITSADCTVPSVSRTSGYVAGFLRMAIPTGTPSCTFHVGGGTTYRPVALAFASVTTAGNLTGSVTQAAGEHPNIATSGIDAGNDVNHYWTLTNGGVVMTTYTATLNFVAGDVDGGGTPGTDYEIELWNGAWNTTTFSSRTATSTTASGISAFGDLISGKKKFVVTVPGDFNAFETSTAANAITGQIFTKLVSVNFSLDVVAINAGAQLATFTGTVAVDLVTGASGGLNCPGTPATVAGTSQTVSLTNGRGTAAAFNVASAAPDLRVRMRYPNAVSPTVTSCSTDNFSIRPQVFTVTSSNANNSGTGAGTTIKTGANFNLTATAVTGYNGTPIIDNTKIVGTPTAGTVGGSFTAGAGFASGNSFFYSEVGNFGLGPDAVRDAAFTNVDQGPGDCIASSTSNVASGGRYGCSIGSAAVPQSTGSSGFGRFIPDNFNVTYNVPALTPACGAFSYVGQIFNYLIVPVMTVTARNGTNNGLTNATTLNYAGSYMKFTNASLAPAAYDTQAERYLRFDALGGGATPALDVSQLPATTADPTIGTFTAGVGTFTFSGGSGFSFTRSATTPSAAFDADIALGLNVIDADGVTFAANPASFGSAAAGNGMLFSDANALTTTDKSIRYGRLRIGGASGSQLLPLRLPVEAQYWNGSIFVTNTLDSCTTLVAGNVGLGNFGGSLNAGETTATIVNSPLQSGRSAIRLSAPGTSNPGSVDVTLNLGAGINADACNALAPAATAGNKTHLRGAWCTPPGTYSKDPSARARFGINRGSDQSIYRREQ